MDSESPTILPPERPKGFFEQLRRKFQVLASLLKNIPFLSFVKRLGKGGVFSGDPYSKQGGYRAGKATADPIIVYVGQDTHG
jgi:hypothetical protein